MHKLTRTLNTKLLRTRPYIPLAIPPSLPATPQHPHPNIKLPTKVQKRHNVALDYVGAGLAVFVFCVFVDCLDEGGPGGMHGYAFAAVGALAGFEDAWEAEWEGFF
jgi:hypothetical protein